VVAVPTTKAEDTGGSRLIMLAIWLIGAGLLVIGVNAQLPRWAPPPVPSPAAARPPQAAIPRARALAAGHRRGDPGTAPMPRSVPVSLRIPAIGVKARVIPLGLDADGGAAVPSLSTPFLTSWYDRGPAPGEAGPAVLLGHVDSAAVGPAVFYKLGDLVPGDLVYVTRRDHRTAVFRVTAVALYPEQDFPAKQVYGFTARPTLRLVTCGGDFDEQTHRYLDRTIAFAAYAGES
jgi:sortase (surface protein transpeptidase)